MQSSHKTGRISNKMILRAKAGGNVFLHTICNLLACPGIIKEEGSGVLVTIEQLSELQKIPIMELRREELSDADGIVIDSSKSLDQRVQSFFRQMKNPFAQNVGEYILQVGYAQGVQETLDERMVQLVRKQTTIM